jgi:hypothetical protein
MSVVISHAEAKALGWTRVDARPWSKLRARWRSTSGWQVYHCGHPTAHTPWALIDPQGAMVCTGIFGPHKHAAYGTAWPSLRSALEAGARLARADEAVR